MLTQLSTFIVIAIVAFAISACVGYFAARYRAWLFFAAFISMMLTVVFLGRAIGVETTDRLAGSILFYLFIFGPVILGCLLGGLIVLVKHIAQKRHAPT